MPTKPCIGPAASLYRERFDLPMHHGMSVLTFNGSRGSEGNLGKQQSSHADPPVVHHTRHVVDTPGVDTLCYQNSCNHTAQKGADDLYMYHVPYK